MLNGINEIIKTVGGSKRKLTTLLILLVFVGGFYVFKTVIFKNDCSDLIEQNQKLISKNVDIVNVNNKLMDNNNLLLTKITTMEELLANKDTVFIKVPIRVVSSTVAENTVEHLEVVPVVHMMTRAPLSSDTLTIEMPVDTNNVIDTNHTENHILIEHDSIKTDTIKKVGFFKRLFGRR